MDGPEGKIYVNFWMGEGQFKKEDIGLEHGDEIDELDLFKTVNGLYQLGLNVMLYHAGENTIIWVDSKRFTQR